MHRYQSQDGLLSSSGPSAVAQWDSIGVRMASERSDWTARLRDAGVKLAHPDDGWVHEPGRGYSPNNPATWLSPCYPQFDDKPEVGDLIALGWPWMGYRLVRVTEVRTRRGIVGSGGFEYHYDDTGQRLPEPVAKPRGLARLLRRT